jgi:hypothetical protein
VRKKRCIARLRTPLSLFARTRCVPGSRQRTKVWRQQPLCRFPPDVSTTRSARFGCSPRLGARPLGNLGQRPRRQAATTISPVRGSARQCRRIKQLCLRLQRGRPCSRQCRCIKELWLWRERPSDRRLLWRRGGCLSSYFTN